MCGLCMLGLRAASGLGRRHLLAVGAALGAGLGAAAAYPAAARAPKARAAARPSRLVMIDPGHGGHDPGAISPGGAFEKTITLATGLALRQHLAGRGIRTAMTRQTDSFVTLQGRVDLAVAAGADLFIALHCDHLPDASLRGASMFTLSDQASDGLSARLAADENAVDQGPGLKLHGVSPQVLGILASMETRATKVGSATLARDVEQSFAGTVPLLPDPRRSANFAVLRDPSIPSTLVEMGCLTNPLDERLLTSARHRDLLAARLAQAVDAYFASA